MKKDKQVQIVKKKICRNGYLRGYWKGELIALIPQYQPGANPEDYFIEEVEFPSNKFIPRIIDSKDTPLSVIKEICDSNDFPFYWVTEIRAENLNNTIEKVSIAEAFEYFLVFGSNGTSLAQYRRIFHDLIRGSVINPDVSVISYLEKAEKVEADALKFSSLEENSDKKRYNYNDKIHNMLKSFHAFLQNPNHFTLKYKKTNQNPSKLKKAKHYRVNRKNCMTNEEAIIFFPALKSINPIHELIARVLWWFNHEICDHPDAPCVHLESVLLMQSSDVGSDTLADIRPSLPENVGGNSVSVCSYTFHGYKMVSYYVPGTMYAELSALAKNTDQFLFRNSFGGSINPRQIRKSFAEACKKANLRSITPNQLR